MPVLETPAAPDLIRQLGAVSSRVFASLPHPAWVVERDRRRVVELNDAAVAVYGTAGDGAELYLGPAGPTGVAPASSATEADPWGAGVRVETRRHEDRNGDELWVELLCVPLGRDAGALELVVARDVSERRRTIERLKDLQAAIDAATDIVVVSSIPEADGEEPVVHYANAAFEELTGWRAERLPGSCLSRLAHPDNAPETKAAFLAALAERRAITQEMLVRRPDGSVVWADVSMTPSRPEDPRQRCVWVVRDATERRRVQEQGIHAARLEAVGQLAGGLAHDFNNLLAVMTSAVQTAVGALPAGHPAREALREAEMATSRAHALTGQMLALSRRDGDQRQLLDARDVVLDLEPLLRRLASEADVELELSEAPAPVHADVGHLEQVLLNLVANARDAMAGTGRVRVAVGADGDEVRLAVADHGSGMDEATLAQATEAFFTTKPRGSGTGLGLSTARTIAERHGGRLEIDTALGRGTTVTVVLPRSAQGPAPAAEPATAHGPVDGPVLLVEDNAALRRLLSASLRQAGLEVREEDGCGEIGEVVAGGPYRLVVSDMRLHGGTALDLLCALRAHQPNVPVLCISGQDLRGGALPGVDGNVRMLPKPFNLTELSEAVAALI